MSHHGECPICGVVMPQQPGTNTSAYMFRRSADHILPQSRGGRKKIHGDTKNTRIVCQTCNELLACCGHCIGAMACVRAVTRTMGPVKFPDKRMAMRWWKKMKTEDRNRVGIYCKGDPVPNAATARE